MERTQFCIHDSLTYPTKRHIQLTGKQYYFTRTDRYSGSIWKEALFIFTQKNAANILVSFWYYYYYLVEPYVIGVSWIYVWNCRKLLLKSMVILYCSFSIISAAWVICTFLQYINWERVHIELKITKLIHNQILFCMEPVYLYTVLGIAWSK